MRKQTTLYVDTEDVNLSKLWERAEDRGAWGTAFYGVEESDTT